MDRFSFRCKLSGYIFSFADVKDLLLNQLNMLFVIFVEFYFIFPLEINKYKKNIKMKNFWVKKHV